MVGFRRGCVLMLTAMMLLLPIPAWTLAPPSFLLKHGLLLIKWRDFTNFLSGPNASLKVKAARFSNLIELLKRDSPDSSQYILYLKMLRELLRVHGKDLKFYVLGEVISYAKADSIEPLAVKLDILSVLQGIGSEEMLDSLKIFNVLKSLWPSAKTEQEQVRILLQMTNLCDSKDIWVKGEMKKWMLQTWNTDIGLKSQILKKTVLLVWLRCVEQEDGSYDSEFVAKWKKDSFSSMDSSQFTLDAVRMIERLEKVTEHRRDEARESITQWGDIRQSLVQDYNIQTVEALNQSLDAFLIMDSAA